MSAGAPARARRRAASGVALGVVVGGAAAAGACVRVETGPEVIAATRLADTPPSIVRGDSLRDASGAVTTLAATAYDDRGAPVANVPIRYYYVPTVGDTTTTAARDTSFRVDSITGAVYATTDTLRTQGVVAVRVGGQLQVLDTLLIVRAPTATAGAVAAVGAVRYDCTDDRTALAAVPDTGAAPLVYNASQAFGVTVLGDSAGTLVAVPSRLVRWTVVSPMVPATRSPSGGPADTVATLTVVDSATGTRQLVDTTNSVGRSAVRLRIRPTGLGRDVLSGADNTVVLRGVVQRGPRAVPGDTITVTVLIRRQALTETAASAACQ